MGSYKINLSKFLSFLLRHAAPRYGVKLDEHGYALLGEVVDVLKIKFRNFKKEDLLDLVANDPKGRFEIDFNKIRAAYGHSVNVLPKGKPVKPLDILYHGTTRENAQKILREGLKPMGRLFVHLSPGVDEAFAVGLRRTKKPIILKIMAKEANASNIEFFKEGNLFLAKTIPREYIEMS